MAGSAGERGPLEERGRGVEGKRGRGGGAHRLRKASVMVVHL